MQCLLLYVQNVRAGLTAEGRISRHVCFPLISFACPKQTRQRKGHFPMLRFKDKYQWGTPQLAI